MPTSKYKSSVPCLLYIISVCMFCRQYMQGAVCESKVRLDGKVAIITGSNTGIGKANAEDFVLRGETLPTFFALEILCYSLS